MKTEQLSIFSTEKDKQAILRAAELLKQGGLVAIPTETVYGLAANAFDSDAVQNIFAAKGRPNDNPLIVHIADLEGLSELISALPESASHCINAFWPGPFTAVLPRSNKVPNAVSAGLSTVAVRMPSHPVAREIIRAAGIPLAAPSANLSGSPSPTTAAHVIADLDGKIDAIVLSDDCSVGLESTVVSFCAEHPTLLRPGGITVEQLKEIVPDLLIDPAVLSQPSPNKPVSSPGMKYKHYSPMAEVVMVDASSLAFTDYVNQNAKTGTAALCYSEDESLLSVPFLSLGSVRDQKKQAERLFSALRQMDEKGYQTVYAHAPSKKGVGLAVYNRLIRAAGFKVVTL